MKGISANGTGNPDWNLLTADVDAIVPQSHREDRGRAGCNQQRSDQVPRPRGQIDLYHGWDDPAISPWNTIAYYQTVQNGMGAKQADSFVRLYMAPGMEHCTGGPGPSAFGQLGIATTGGPKYGVFDALVDWREKGIHNSDCDKIQLRREGDDDPATVPLPGGGKIKGTGDTNEAANFVCSRP